MQLRRTVVMAAVVPFGLAVAGLAIAAVATGGFASTGTQSVAQRMPLIGSGTHPVTPPNEGAAASLDSWGVGNG